MSKIRQRIKIYALMAMLFLVILLIESTWWPMLFGALPAPLLWLNIIVFISLRRGLYEGLFVNYSLMLLLKAFTAQKIGTLWLSIFAITVTMNFLRQRVFWPGARYFVAATTMSTLIFQVSCLLISRLFDSVAPDILWSARLAELILTPLLASPLYFLLAKTDSLFEFSSVRTQVGSS